MQYLPANRPPAEANDWPAGVSQTHDTRGGFAPHGSTIFRFFFFNSR
jgi:hypothetical protein